MEEKREVYNDPSNLPNAAQMTPPEWKAHSGYDKAMLEKGEPWTDGLADPQIHLLFLRLYSKLPWTKIADLTGWKMDDLRASRDADWYKNATQKWLEWVQDDVKLKCAQSLSEQHNDMRVISAVLTSAGLLRKKPEVKQVVADDEVQKNEELLRSGLEELMARKRRREEEDAQA